MKYITTAGGILALLDEPQKEMQVFAMERLNEVTDIFWPEVSDAIQKIEKLEEDVTFPKREMAALIVSKVYFHLGSYSDSLNYALRAGPLLYADPNSLYIDTIKIHAIDRYIELRTKKDSVMNEQLETLLNDMFRKCIKDQQYKHAIGIALETNKMDWFREAVLSSEDIVGNLTYSYKIAMQYIEQRKFRDQVLEELVNLYEGLSVPDFVNMSQCLIHLDKPQQLSTILDQLIKDDSMRNKAMDNELMAYQIAFDLYESATQDLLLNVRKWMRSTAPLPYAFKDPSQKKEEEEKTKKESPEKTEETKEEDEDVEMKEPKKEKDSLTKKEQIHQTRLEKLEKILSGEMMIEQHLQFLISNNHTDLLVLKQTKDAVRASVCHTATVIANAFMHCGTTSDTFLRDNLDWLSRATNWAKMSATASLGVIHRGHEKEALTLMQAYLPKESSSPGYAESGSLFALGLIHANHGSNIIDYLLQQVRDTQSEVVRHGACLGLGLAAMGTQRMDIYDQMNIVIHMEDAVNGEAAGLAMGLVLLGSGNEKALTEMIDYCVDSEHEKILRGVAQGIALIMYGQQDQANSLIDRLIEDKNAILRRAGMYVVAMAYCGTASTPAMKKLLHVAVSDVDNDVRRAAVEALGFLLFRSPEQTPSMVSLLAESYNPHVRYGAAMALGIACSGTGFKEALSLLEPLTNDPVNFVRQGALIASALVLIQQTESTCSKVKEYRQLYTKVIADKHEDSIAKFGAILAQGIIDAGGRNMTIALQSRTGHTNMTSLVGMFVFTQFWYWYPLSHFLSLSFTPTCLIGLNSELKMPKIGFISNAKPSVYGYPAPLEEKKKEVAEKVTAVLSITAKAKKKDEDKKKKEQKDEKMEVDEEKPKEEEKKEEKKKEEPNFDTLNNPARVMKQQLKVVRLPENCRYVPTKELSIGGVILMRDTQPDTAEDLVQPVAAMGPKTEEELEPEPPESFEYIDED